MSRVPVAFLARLALVWSASATLGGCASMFGLARETNERQCLARAMYFESNRSSDDGMLAVGTVVMNRRESGRYPRTICGVVGQSNQFAPGALTTPMDGVGRSRALRVADRVLAGERHPGLEHVYFFHTAGYSYPYQDMQYKLVAGGNAFYEKRTLLPGEPEETQMAALQRQEPDFVDIPAPLPRPAVLNDAAPPAESPLPAPTHAPISNGLAELRNDGFLDDEGSFDDGSDASTLF